MGTDITLTHKKRILIEKNDYYPGQKIRPLAKPIVNLCFVDGDIGHVYAANDSGQPGCTVHPVYRHTYLPDLLIRCRKDMTHIRPQLSELGLLLVGHPRRRSWITKRLFCVPMGVFVFVTTRFSYTLGRWPK